MTRKALCESCRKLCMPEAAYCKDCAEDGKAVRVYIQRLVSMRPELRGLTFPQVFLRLAKAYLLEGS